MENRLIFFIRKLKAKILRCTHFQTPAAMKIIPHLPLTMGPKVVEHHSSLLLKLPLQRESQAISIHMVKKVKLKHFKKTFRLVKLPKILLKEIKRPLARPRVKQIQVDLFSSKNK